MNILYVTTVSSTMSFFTQHVKMLLEQGHKVDFACSVTSSILSQFLDSGCRVFDLALSRSPLDRANFSGYKKLRSLLNSGKYDVVHVHTPVAAALTRMASINLSNVKVIYTAHGFHFYSGAPWLNWVLYYPIEKWLAKYTDVLITINKEDYERACKHFRPGRVEYVPGVGLDVKHYSQLNVDYKRKRKELGLSESEIVLVSTGELNRNKNHETVIRALQTLKNRDVKYLICGDGPLRGELQSLVRNLGLENQVMLLGFRSDIKEINYIADIFLLPSFREGLSVALMEAMASGLPVICSNIRGNRDLIKDGVGGYLVDPKDVKGFSKLIQKLIDDVHLREAMKEEKL